MYTELYLELDIAELFFTESHENESSHWDAVVEEIVDGSIQEAALVSFYL